MSFGPNESTKVLLTVVGGLDAVVVDFTSPQDNVVFKLNDDVDGPPGLYWLNESGVWGFAGNSVPEAPQDGWPYARIDGAWVRQQSATAYRLATDALSDGNISYVQPAGLDDITLLANSFYRLEMFLITSGNPTDDIRVRLVKLDGLSDAILQYTGDLDNAAAAVSTWDTIQSIATSSIGTVRIANYIGIISTGTDPGVFALEFRKILDNTADDSKLSAGSTIFLRRIE